MEKYYPQKDYYSFSVYNYAGKSANPFSKTFRNIQSEYLLFRKNKLLGWLFCTGYVVPGYYRWLRKVHASYDTSILDVGSGGGELLFRLHRIGFTNLTGVDPFIEKDIFADGVKIYKKDIFDVEGMYDFIMINHAFEHMDEPLSVLKKAHKLLSAGGSLMIRVPVSDAYCWHLYKENWAPLDAPRHLYIHSARSMKILVDKAGFTIKDMVHDATAFQFWGSEQYAKDISLIAENSYNKNKSKSIFDKSQIRKYRRQIAALNKQQMGGDAVFYLHKK
ncbi:MAG: class I SAM-dependent methyltransferase [Chitinophagaceae bacterium]